MNGFTLFILFSLMFDKVEIGMKSNHERDAPRSRRDAVLTGLGPFISL